MQKQRIWQDAWNAGAISVLSDKRVMFTPVCVCQHYSDPHFTSVLNRLKPGRLQPFIAKSLTHSSFPTPTFMSLSPSSSKSYPAHSWICFIALSPVNFPRGRHACPVATGRWHVGLWRHATRWQPLNDYHRR